MHKQRQTIPHGSWILLSLIAAGSFATEPKPRQEESKQDQRRSSLSQFNSLVGSWRGVGRPRRSRSEGAWTEKADWIWAFGAGGPSLKYSVHDGKQLKSAELFWDTEKNEFQMSAEMPHGQKRDYRGALTERKLVMTSAADKAGDVHRARITMLSRKRNLILFEKQTAGRGSFRRVAEVGYTRMGTRLAKDSLGGPECIVTGGLGTIEVNYAGKKYFVCCTGCKQAFDEDPVGTLKAYAEWKARAEEKKHREQEPSKNGAAE